MSNTAQALHTDHDPDTVALLQRGDTLGVNQLESPAMRHLLIQMHPTCLDDVIQALALLRPGAASIGMKDCFIRRRRELEPTRMGHPCLIEVLGETHGLLLYEDDALRLVRALMDHRHSRMEPAQSAANADRFCKRIAKHKLEEEACVLQAEFVALCQRQQIPGEAIAELWRQLSKFNRYSFCKSHAVSYGLLAWNTAYLKAHFPLPFWTAVLNNNQGSYPRRVYIEAIKRAGLPLCPPCINRSEDVFVPEYLGQPVLRVGLGAIAKLPVELRCRLLAERKRQGPFRDLTDFHRRVRPGPESLSLLIRAGALDFTGRSRPALLLEADLQSKRRPGEAELLSYNPLADWQPTDHSTEQKLRDQWQLMGFVLGPPLFTLFAHAKETGKKGIPLIASHEVPHHAGQLVRVQGLVATARHVFTEAGKPIQFVTLEDEHGFTEVTLFAGTCEQVAYLTIGPYLATGVVEERHGAYTLTAQRFELQQPRQFTSEARKRYP